jgi:hypothetical protein
MEFTIGDGDTVQPHEIEIGIETGSVSTLIRMLAVGMMVPGAVFAVLDRCPPPARRDRRHPARTQRVAETASSRRLPTSHICGRSRSRSLDFIELLWNDHEKRSLLCLCGEERS